MMLGLSSARSKRPGRLRNMRKPNSQQTKPVQTLTTFTKNRSQLGQALVEFALVLMFIILPLTFVMVDGALMLFTYLEVTNAAREAARAAAIYQYQCPASPAPCATDPTYSYDQQVAMVDAARDSYVDTYFQSEDTRWLSALIGYSQCTHQITYNPDPPGIGNTYREMDSMSLTLACPRRLLFGLLNTGQITLTGGATMRIEPGGVAP